MCKSILFNPLVLLTLNSISAEAIQIQRFELRRKDARAYNRAKYAAAAANKAKKADKPSPLLEGAGRVGRAAAQAVKPQGTYGTHDKPDVYTYKPFNPDAPENIVGQHHRFDRRFEPGPNAENRVAATFGHCWAGLYNLGASWSAALSPQSQEDIDRKNQIAIERREFKPSPFGDRLANGIKGPVDLGFNVCRAAECLLTGQNKGSDQAARNNPVLALGQSVREIPGEFARDAYGTAGDVCTGIRNGRPITQAGPALVGGVFNTTTHLGGNAANLAGQGIYTVGEGLQGGARGVCKCGGMAMGVVGRNVDAAAGEWQTQTVRNRSNPQKTWGAWIGSWFW